MVNVFKNRKTLYLVLSIVMICIFTLTIVYAALNAVLEINGNAEVVASSWDIYLDNVKVTSGSVSNEKPVITNSTTASFSTTLTNPGDFYEFTIDVVNNGSIDAMIDSIEKTPTLTESQAKYLNYVVEYQNGDSINAMQLVEANSFVRFKVRLEFKKNIIASDLPTLTETLNLSFTVNYIQSDGNGNVINNSGINPKITIVSGDGTNTSDEVCIEDECFYVISSTDETVTMLSKYNLHVGYSVDETWTSTLIENPTGIQHESAKGYVEEFPLIGITLFSNNNYWPGTVAKYPAYVYDSNSLLYNYVENYKIYLKTLGVFPTEARLISFEELIALGCNTETESCSEAPNWVYLTSYWSGSVYDAHNVWLVNSNSYFNYDFYGYDLVFGVRPVITISRSLL